MKVVLVNPDIPWNTGNIGRTCVATDNELVLVGRMGFKISDREIRRSGLDYWQYLKYSIYPDFNDFLKTLSKDENLIFFSSKGRKNLWDAHYTIKSCLIFGSETKGLPLDFYHKYENLLYKIPMFNDKVRSLNLSTCAGIAIYTAIGKILSNR